MTLWMLMLEEVQDAKKIKLSSTDNENFFSNIECYMFKWQLEITLLHKSQNKKSLKNYYCYAFSEVDNVKCSFQISNSSVIKVLRVQTNQGVLDLFCNLINETLPWLIKSICRWYYYSDSQRKMTKPISKTEKNKMHILSCFIYNFTIILPQHLHRKKGHKWSLRSKKVIKAQVTYLNSFFLP